MISNIECLKDLSGLNSFNFKSFSENTTYNTNRFIPLWYDNRIEALL